ncbi:MAG: right-handed parallel beta-helix repeat-containing protein [Candidatus Omnitrophica bacterium]|nr:right-handed parallel beta-helix repeat-containing protein [Candidatus Omnitrophota bacterium]
MQNENRFFKPMIVWASLIGILIGGHLAGAATVTVNPGDSIQAAIDSADPGDEIILNAGVYEEDINIGDMNAPLNRKDNITLKAADGADVEIHIPNSASRLELLGGLGADFGPADRMGFLVYGDGVTVEGISFTQLSGEVNNFEISVLVTVISNDVTFRDCEFIGVGAEAAGDAVGLAVTPLDAIALDQGLGGLATNLTVEDCVFHDLAYSYGNANFLQELGVPAPSPEATLTGCEFYDCGTCINMDDGLATLVDCYIHDNQGTGVDASDDGVTLINCRIENCLEHGVEISDSESEDDEPQENPIVTIENCLILNCGTDTNHNGINSEHGTITVKNTVISGSTGPNVFFETEDGRMTTATFDHCDIYNSLIGTAIGTTASPQDVITLTITNSNIVDLDGIINDAGAFSTITLDYCNIFVSGEPYLPDQEFITATNMLSADPLYVDPDNGDFTLQPGSPMATAGQGGTYIGSQGLETRTQGWMLH